jgi:hypothetical protein
VTELSGGAVLTITIVAVQLTLLARPEAARAGTPGPGAGRCAELGNPAPPARIEGRVVSRDQKPSPDVPVRATLHESGRVFTTTSDREGHFASAGFPSDVTVALEVDGPETTVGCSLEITRKAPVRTVTVVLAARTETTEAADVGCEGLPSWSRGASARLPTREDAGSSDAAQKPSRLELRSRDIVRVIWREDGATVMLNDSARKALEEFTAANLNRPALVTIDGMETSTGAPYVYGVVGSGMLHVPQDALRGPLCRTLDEVSQAGR